MRGRWSVKQSLVLALRSCGERGEVQRNASTAYTKIWSKTQVRLACGGLPPGGQRCRWKCCVRSGRRGWQEVGREGTVLQKQRKKECPDVHILYVSCLPALPTATPSWSALDWLFYEGKEGQAQKEKKERKEVNTTLCYGGRKWEASKFTSPWSTSWRYHSYLKVCNKKC